MSAARSTPILDIYGQHMTAGRIAYLCDVASDNAHAMACAVDLLAQRDELVDALKDLVCLNSCGLYGNIPEGWPEQTKQAIRAARAAIARAEGGAK